ncbi:MAG TPA: lysoplasmalogenase family protein, partial [Longimicrobium sp.]|nr:lysoplasmalogenase family protein [Longimicrobium sp.]
MPAAPAVLALAAAAAALGAIAAEARGRRRAFYLLKPLATALVLALALVTAPGADPAYRALIAAGLLFSLFGDVFLMLPEDRFVAGLASFLVAHLLYTAAFVRDGAGFSPGLAVVLAVFG